MLICFVIDVISQKKFSLTGEPLSFNDVIAGSNVSLASKYLAVDNLIFCFEMILVGIFLLFLDGKLKTQKAQSKVIAILLFITIPMAFSPYLTVSSFIPFWVKEKVSKLNYKYEMDYFSWNWSGNVLAHGLPMHLIQTSVRIAAPRISKEGLDEYHSFRKSYALTKPINKTIIFILCESCWYDNNNFKDIFQPLLNHGMTPFRATSPVYGGGTANVEFEMLTGLPSNSRYLSGILYQEYEDVFKDNTESFASVLKRSNYYAFAAHNNDRAFWKRVKVYPKFGFDQFEDIFAMGELPAELSKGKKPYVDQADDYLLYRAALKELREKNGKPIFMNLITMSTHGPFPYMNDSGETVYRSRAEEAVSRLTDFLDQVETIDKDALVVVYGDHKPALNKYFYDRNVLPHQLFLSVGEKDEDFTFKKDVNPLEFGDVPVFIKSSDKEAIAQFVKSANQKPYFCVVSLVDKYFIRSGMLSANYMQQHGCQESIYNGYNNLIGKVPSWLYSVSLFDNVAE
ncbi:MAG: hypothetical protein H6R25_3650 [Proteobacteria bacterium]|nr:hypothetical protein [Pseudomonadota bacterium]